MIALALRRFCRLTYLSFFRAKGTEGRLTRKRVKALVKLYLTLWPLQFIHLFFLLLDDVLFPGYRRVQIKAPVFIVGNPRGGTTHTLRLVAQDEERFHCAKTWESLLAPAICERKLIRALSRLDRRMGGKMNAKLTQAHDDLFHDLDQFHQIDLKAADEDEGFFGPIFATIQFIFMFPFLNEFDMALAFDQKTPPADKKTFIRFYRGIIQRALYVNGPEKQYLSKGPSNTFRIEALRQAFPDAKFIYVARNPLQTIPSQMSFLAYTWHAFCDIPEKYPFREFLFKNSGAFYRYPLEALEGNAPESSYAIVKYDDLVSDPKQTVADIYAGLGMTISPRYAAALDRAAEKAAGYKSQHAYSLGDTGFTREDVVAEYRDIFERFGFDTGENWTNDAKS